MKKFLWSTNDGCGRLYSYVVVECSEETAKKIESQSYERKWKIIADKLHEHYTDRFPEWFTDYGKRNIFWYNNVLEDYEDAYERIVEKRTKEIRDSFDDPDDLRCEAEWQVLEDLESLPLFVM